MEFKTCSKCKRRLENSEFYKNIKLESGLDSWCKDCYRKSSAMYYATENGKIKKRNRRKHVRNFLSIVPLPAKNTAQVTGNKEQKKLKTKLPTRKRHRKTIEEQREGRSLAVKKWKERNKELMRAIRRGYLERNREEVNRKQREWKKENREKIKRWRKLSYDKNIIKEKTNYVLGKAVRDGKIIKQPCEVCGSKINVLGHHHDYSKPVDVIWLCQIHHARLHALDREIKKGVSTPPYEQTQGSTNNVNNTLRAG